MVYIVWKEVRYFQTRWAAGNKVRKQVSRIQTMVRGLILLEERVHRDSPLKLTSKVSLVQLHMVGRSAESRRTKFD